MRWPSLELPQSCTFRPLSTQKDCTSTAQRAQWSRHLCRAGALLIESRLLFQLPLGLLPLPLVSRASELRLFHLLQTLCVMVVIRAEVLFKLNHCFVLLVANLQVVGKLFKTVTKPLGRPCRSGMHTCGRSGRSLGGLQRRINSDLLRSISPIIAS